MIDRTFGQAVRDTIDGVTASDMFVSLYSDDMAKFESDPLPAIQLAVAILANKPIILAILPGVNPPAKLLAIADYVVRGTPQEIAAVVTEIAENGP